MTNIWLFLATVFVYGNIVSLFKWAKLTEALERLGISYLASFRTTWNLKELALLLLLCAPFNINGHVFTVLGNAVSEKNNISVLSFYQKAGDSAITLFSFLGYQSASGDVFVLAGIPSYQNSAESSLVIGVSLYQTANKNAVVAFGLSIYQAAAIDAVVGTGFSLYQKAGVRTLQIMGVSAYQKADYAATVVGFSGYQEVNKAAFAPFAFYQKQKGQKSRSFGIFNFGDGDLSLILNLKDLEKMQKSTAAQPAH